MSLGGAMGTVPATICGTFLFLYGRSGKLGDNEHRLVAYEWTKGDCKELGIYTYGVKNHILCYAEGTVVLPHGKLGKAINGSSFLINPPLVKVPNLFIRHCGCKGNKGPGCECCQPYSDAYKFSVEDVAANGFRILRDTEEEVGPDISKNQLAGNPDAQGGKKRKHLRETSLDIICIRERVVRTYVQMSGIQWKHY
ncbi:uncharacterized protein LOC131018214 [Salvia miltiorrhiza]|uniref:uncharacterized protein LOC131018214 n=1 Tax=Salvia miltiorrhiza TaxID=226208 RepID=UPI0025AD5988|nr:uncharacterized protein LOC131018214 [Salvia miltiorrhiza]